MQDLIGSLSICALTGYALSLVLAALLSQWTNGLSILGVSAGLLLAAGPIYLGVDSVMDQGVGSIALATVCLAFGLYCLRGWWVPERFPITPALGSHFQATTNALHVMRQERLIEAYPTLHHRTVSVVRSDRQLQRQSRNTSFADAGWRKRTHFPGIAKGVLRVRDDEPAQRVPARPHKTP
jgi:hypothetical protein